MDEKITLKINGDSFAFNVTPDLQERLINEMKVDNKVDPMHNFLTRTVDPEHKDALAPFLKMPSSVIEIGTKVLEEYSPKLKITVGE